MDYQIRIKRLREINNYTQEYVGRVLNIGQRTYADYELGKIRISVDSMIKLAELYDADMNYICGLTEVQSKYPCSNTDQVSK